MHVRTHACTLAHTHTLAHIYTLYYIILCYIIIYYIIFHEWMHVPVSWIVAELIWPIDLMTSRNHCIFHLLTIVGRFIPSDKTGMIHNLSNMLCSFV